MAFSIHSIFNVIFRIWRRKRFVLFLDLMKPRPTDTLLDIGGVPEFWTSHPQAVARIDALNIYERQWDPATAPHHRIQVLVGNGCALTFPDKSYDIAFSNSVIEHVGSWDNQKRFAAEVRRVADALWVQTPAYECPIEPHYLTPFVHYIPVPIRRKVVRWFTVWGLLSKPNEAQIREMVEETRLIRRREMVELFPDCEIITERMLGFIPKSYVAFRRRSAP